MFSDLVIKLLNYDVVWIVLIRIQKGKGTTKRRERGKRGAGLLIGYMHIMVTTLSTHLLVVVLTRGSRS